MRLIILLAVLMTAVTASAISLDSTAPLKPTSQGTPPPADPAVLRQGGDTIADAVPIPIPYEITGTTIGYANDYDEVCPYDGSTSPDVVYALSPGADISVNIDLGGSAYDTKVYVYDADLNLVACNDDFYPDYTSKLEDVLLVGGMQYSLVIDGYGDSSGDYNLVIEDYVECILDCPAGGQLEGEPPLVEGYIDSYNSGCGGESWPGDFQPITSPVFCGVSGWFDTSRDTDWFLYTMPASGVLEVTGDAEKALYMFELGPTDCADVGVIQNVIVGPCNEATMTIVGEPGSIVWFWTGPTTFGEGVVEEFDYVLISNIEGTTAIENHSLTGIKGLFQ